LLKSRCKNLNNCWEVVVKFLSRFYWFFVHNLKKVVGSVYFVCELYGSCSLVVFMQTCQNFFKFFSVSFHFLSSNIPIKTTTFHHLLPSCAIKQSIGNSQKLFHRDVMFKILPQKKNYKTFTFRDNIDQ
jgi:hypothetical protein